MNGFRKWRVEMLFSPEALLRHGNSISAEDAESSQGASAHRNEQMVAKRVAQHLV